MNFLKKEEDLLSIGSKREKKKKKVILLSFPGQNSNPSSWWRPASKWRFSRWGTHEWDKLKELGLCSEFSSPGNALPPVIQLQRHLCWGGAWGEGAVAALRNHRLWPQRESQLHSSHWLAVQHDCTTSHSSFLQFQSQCNINSAFKWSFGALNGMVVLKETFHFSVPKWLLLLKTETATLLKPLLSRWEGNYGF